MKLLSFNPLIGITDYKVHSRINYNKSHLSTKSFEKLSNYIYYLGKNGYLKFYYYNIYNKNEGKFMVKKEHSFVLAYYIYKLIIRGKNVV